MAAIISSEGHNLQRERGEAYINMDWDKIGYDVISTDQMFIMKSSKDGTFTEGMLIPFGPIEINPNSSVLNYGQGLFEGMKAYRKKDGGIQTFRPQENAMRMQMGAERLLLVAPSVEQYVYAIKQVVLANERWIPPYGKGSLYIRPLLFGSGPVMGISPSPETTFLIYTNPIGNKYKGHAGEINLLIENSVPRAFPGGTGGIKNISNYSPVLHVTKEAKAKGFTDVLFLDAVEHKYIEEVSSCNVFILKGNVISTPPATGTILPGVTRKSIIHIALDLGYEVEERRVLVEEIIEADEVFCTGTAVGISPVKSITYQDKRVEFKIGDETTSMKLFRMIRGIQSGDLEDKNGWTAEID
ncbi:LOW QUALITY PROTEIN: branched-chain-amino-acid aminotransferase 2, chloroplastic-like [Prosopis cineraria]|uniref:LOW QUALITY PROTEIN: branched-chain-amino-acid aminotransferase 2, chloroplastic-like n=1 Tax=Prosopis cineraria TaxID=364024 RepID=UPI00240FB455|nr:LOW QUALITY PROTEIN: branched-chain-amino-acid aminotransferase 2, chloroplastic-like [Prosopis cineraria]